MKETIISSVAWIIAIGSVILSILLIMEYLN
jgi:hypothetical protein